MPVARFQMPDGRIGRFEVPEGTSPEQAQQMIESHLSTQQAPKAETKPQSRGTPPSEGPGMLESFSAGTAYGLGRGLTGLAKLAGKGLEMAGATETGKTLQEMGAAGREWLGRGVAPYEQAYPMITGTGEFIGESVVPVGVVSKGARAIQAVGKAIPQAARVTAPLAESFGTGGFSTGMQPGAANVLAKLAGGAGAGATTSAVLSGGELGDVGVGGAIGAVTPFALPALGRLGYETIGKLGDVVTGQTAKVKAGEIAQKIAGPKLEELRAATAANPELSAGQAGADVQRNAWQALAKSAADKDPEEFVNALLEKQGQDRVNTLAALAQGPTRTASAQARNSAKDALNAAVGPLMEQELKAAGTAGEFYKKAIPKIQEKQASMEDALRQSGQVYAYSNQAQQALRQKLEGPTPGWVSAKTIDDLEQNVLKARQATEDLYAMKGQRQAERDFIQQQVASLKAHGLEPINTENIVRNISQKLRDPKIGVSDENQKALVSIADKIQEWTTKNGGYIDPAALHEIRKTYINEAIEKQLAGRDPSYVKKQAASIIKQVRPLIDDAIEAAGGTQWRQALKMYEQGAREIDRTKFADEAMRVYQQSPEQFISLVKGDNPDLVSKVFGPGNFDIKEMMGNQYGTLKKVADELERDIRIGKRAEKGRQVAAEAVEEEKAGFRLPGFLSPKATITNKTLDILEGKVNKSTMNALVKGMQTGQSANELLNAVPFGERNKILMALRNKAAGLKRVESTIGTVQPTVSREQ